MIRKGSLAEQIEEQKQSNQSALAYASWFAEHRQRLSDLITSHAPAGGAGRLCVLGAGNGYDLDLPRLAERYAELHLADIDGAALQTARAAAPEAAQGRVTLHELDLSGLHGELEDWRALRVTPEAMMAAPVSASKRVAAGLPGPFDVVVSACLQSQLQLSLLNLLTDRHPLFAAAREIQNLVHLRSLVRLLAGGGCGLLVNDLTSDLTFPLHELSPDADLCALTFELSRRGNVIHSTNPELIRVTAREDPYLARHAELLPLQHAWLWHNGPARTFLVYALELRRR